MKKIMTLMMVLLLLFSVALTGCGGDTEEPAAEEPAATEEPAAEESSAITQEDVMVKYNEAAELFTELDGALLNNGTYDANADVKASMDSIIEFLDKAVVVVQSDEITEEEMDPVYDELQSLVDQMNGFKDTYL